MKKILPALVLITILFVTPGFSQEFTELMDGEDAQIVGMLVSYNVVKRETKKGNDLYRLTATVTNQKSKHTHIFDVAMESFIEEPQNAIAYFQFTNANGKALSATSAHFYSKPLYITVPYKCKKCTPVKEDEDPYNHYTKSVVIGSQFPIGSTISKVYHIRVPKGEVPTVRVMIY